MRLLRVERSAAHAKVRREVVAEFRVDDVAEES